MEPVKKYYLDTKGNIIPEAYTNRHHLIHPANRYRGGDMLRFRELGGFVLRITIDSHNDLHRAVKPPITVNKQLRDELTKLQRGATDINPYDRLDNSLEYLYGLSRGESILNKQAGYLLENLTEQRRFISIGRVSFIGFSDV